MLFIVNAGCMICYQEILLLRSSLRSWNSLINLMPFSRWSCTLLTSQLEIITASHFVMVWLSSNALVLDQW